MNLGPYHIARLRALAAIVPGVQVLEVAAEQNLYPWRPMKEKLGFALTTLFPDRACEAIPLRAQCREVRAALSDLNPQVVVVAGYREPSMQAAAGWARKRGIPVILQFASTYQDRPRTWWKEVLKRRLLKQYARVAATGLRAEEYAVRLGVHPDNICRIGNVVDNAHFVAGAEFVRRDEAEIRRRLGLPAQYFLSVGRLSPEKNFRRLLEAFLSYRACGGRWELVLVGSGPQDGVLRAMVKDHRTAAVHFVSWKPYDELPWYYTLASCLVLPSTSETWGLVVNEAMACGLPVLVSRNCGCVPELCRAGENGFDFDPESAGELAELMLRISSNEGERSAMAQASRRIIASFTPQSWALRLKECIDAAENCHLSNVE